MSGIPSIFLPSAVIAESAASATASSSSVVGEEDPPKTEKRTRKHNEKGAALSKKQMIIPPQEPKSSVGSVFGRLPEKWKARNQEQRTAIFLHNQTREDDLESYSSRIRKLESERDSLKKDNKGLKEKLKKLEDKTSSMDSSLLALKLEKSKLDQLIKEKDTALKSLEETITKITLELEEIKVDRANTWAGEKQKIKEAAYIDGCRDFLKTFMAVDPEYNWAEKFGDEIAKWMKEFSIMEAAAIAERKALLETEEGRSRLFSRFKC